MPKNWKYIKKLLEKEFLCEKLKGHITYDLTVQIPPRPDHLHGQNLPPRRTESAMLTEHYTTVVSNSPPELFHRHSGLQALCLSHKLVCAKVTAGDVDFLSAKSSEQFRYREFQNHST